MIPRTIRHLVVLLFCVSLWGVAHASSSIIDGVIESMKGETLRIRVSHTPYSSISQASLSMTHKDGSYRLRVEKLSDYFTYYIDEIPVTKEQMAAILKPGMRMTMMENRKREYFFTHSFARDGQRVRTLEEGRGKQADAGSRAERVEEGSRFSRSS